MELSLREIEDLFTVADYNEGMQYYRKGAVISQQVSEHDGRTKVESVVRGDRHYQTLFRETDFRNYLSATCSCTRFYMVHSCKHLAASMIYFALTPKSNSDLAAQNLLRAYLEQPPELPQSGEEPVRLVPILYTDRYSMQYGHPGFHFKVGRGQLYVVKNIQSFCSSVIDGETVSYGKNLSFVHRLENFDERSKQMIGILTDQYPALRTIHEETEPSYYQPADSWPRNELTLTGDAFDRMFELFLGQRVETDEKTELLFTEEDPKVSMTVEKNAKGISLAISGEKLYFFGNAKHLYCLTGRALLRCSQSFRRNVYPLVAMGNRKMTLGEEDIPTFCTGVLPKLKDRVEITDKNGILQEYMPHECTPCFYFDMDEELRVEVRYRYENEELQENTPVQSTPQIKRDLVAERAAATLAERYFSKAVSGRVLRPELDSAEFLTERLEAFRSLGEVFISERLQRRRIAPAKVNVGVSLSDGILTLDMDTGEFPAEELEALYQSLLKKKKYHRLKDGRYLTLDGSGYEKMSEMAHMLQLSAKELAKGQVQLPAFRALYLDSLLSDGESFRTQRDKQFRQMIRDFKSVGESDFTIPKSLENTLRNYQQLGFQWLKTLEHAHFGGILADEMGLGKTLQIISYLSSLDQAQIGHPNLVVCPASLILNWGDELKKFAPQLDTHLIYGTAVRRRQLLEQAQGAAVIVTSYELLRQDLEQYRQMEFYCCVLDEAQHVKNQSTRISKAVKQVNCRQRFILTGTPVENRLSELWNLFDFLMPGYLFSHTAFVQKLEKPIIKSGNEEARAQLQKLVQPFLLRRLKKDVLKELPPKLEYTHSVPLSEEERKVYLSAVKAATGSLSGADSKLKILAALTQLRQICCDPRLCFENYSGQSSKLEACLELCSAMVENGHQILLFSQFTSMLDILRERLDQLGISSFTLQGSTTKENRARLVRDFNAGGASVFLISLKAGGTGLNLTAADVVIHYDPWWNIAAQNQATDRAHRIGQQANVQVYKLITKGTIEEKILLLQEKKAELMEMISENAEGGIMSMSGEELLELLQYQGD